MIYELIGRLVVKAVWLMYGRQIRIAAWAGAAIGALGIGAYIASRGEEAAEG